MTVCPKCGTENKGGSKFCGECAAPLPGGSSLDVTLPMMPGEAPAPLTPGAPGQEFAPGTTFAGRFQIIESIGGGGMGRVYKALDTKIGERVALKLIRPELAADPEVLARFSDELRLARHIAHPNVCRMFDMGEEAGAPYISMEYVAGEDLESIIRMTKGLSPGQTAGIGKQVAAGLAEAHRLGVIHRDLKPQNIMIDREGTARIMDFGIARMSRAGRTGLGTMIGTPDYMSPEQAEGIEVDPRTDLYSLGVMLFEMATGRLPFEAGSPVAMAVKHKTELPPDPRSLNTGVPKALAVLILRLLEKDRQARFQTAAEVRDELERIEREVPATAPVVSSRPPSAKRTITLAFPSLKKFAIPFAAVVLLAGGVFLVTRFLPRRGGSAAPKIPSSVAVVGFENQTGDPKFDHLRKAIPELIITNLENMGRFQVTTWERMQDVLKQEGRGIVEVIDAESGFDVCRREGVSAVVTGGFTKAGDTFATNVKLLDAETRKLLKSASSRGEGENSILQKQIDELSAEIARGLTPGRTAGASEVLPTVSVTDVTTTSMEAYAAFLRGRDGYERYRYNEAAVDLERAVVLAPAFATAHYYLARIYRNMGDLKSMIQHFEYARENAAKASEKERLWIEAGYAGYVEQNGEKQVAILRNAVQTFPREKTVWLDLANALYSNRRYNEAVAAYQKALELDPAFGGALNQLAYCYLEMGRHEDAANCLRTYARFYPGDVNPIDSLAEVEYNRGRLAEAEAGYRKVVSADPAFGSDIRLAWMQALQEKYDEALETLRTWAGRATTDIDKSGSRLLQGIILHLEGRERESREALRTGRELAAASAMTDAADLVEGWLEFDRGDWARCRAALRRMSAPRAGETSSRILIPIDPALFEAIVDVAEGKLKSAQRRWAALEKARTLNAKVEQLVEDDLRRLLQARLLAAGGDPERARRILAKDRPVPLLFMNAADLIAYICPLEQDDLARIYVRKGEWDNAIAQYKILTVIGPGHQNRRPVHPIYHYRLAQVYEKRGLPADAAAEYGCFLKVLEKADAESKEMADARKRLAALAAK